MPGELMGMRQSWPGDGAPTEIIHAYGGTEETKEMRLTSKTRQYLTPMEAALGTPQATPLSEHTEGCFYQRAALEAGHVTFCDDRTEEEKEEARKRRPRPDPKRYTNTPWCQHVREALLGQRTEDNAMEIEQGNREIAEENWNRRTSKVLEKIKNPGTISPAAGEWAAAHAGKVGGMLAQQVREERQRGSPGGQNEPT